MRGQLDFLDPQAEFEFGEKIVEDATPIRVIVDELLEYLRSGDEGEWRRPWLKVPELPENAASGHRYSGNNRVRLWTVASKSDYASNRWATLKQWAAFGKRIPKGTKATFIFIPIGWADDEGPEGERQAVKFRRLAVFNENQLFGFGTRQPSLFTTSFEIEGAEDLVRASGASVQVGGDVAYYAPDLDVIRMPSRESFVATDESSEQETWYQTLLHELVHWTGHSERCNREIPTSRSSTPYAFEELVAEMGAAVLCRRLGVSPCVRRDHVHYIRSWLPLIDEAPERIVAAADLAQAAVDYLERLVED